jgi:hypothetical protein
MCRNGRLAVPCKIPLSNPPAPIHNFSQLWVAGPIRDKGGGGGTPHLPRHMGRGVIPSSKKSGRGGRGSPPSPLVRETAHFLHGQTLYFVWNHDGNNKFNMVIIFGGGVISGRRGEGVPPTCSGTWVGGDTLRKN